MSLFDINKYLILDESKDEGVEDKEEQKSQDNKSSVNVDKEQVTKQQNRLTKRFWAFGFGGYIVAGLIYVGSAEFKNTLADEIIVLLIAITAGVLYSQVKKRVDFVKNNILKSSVVGAALIILSMILVGFLTAFSQ